MYTDSKEAKPVAESKPIGEMLLNLRFPSDDNLTGDETAQTLASLKSAEVLSGKKLDLNGKPDKYQKP